jgi:2-polyprenyl-6-methoxyphenol hydroxylase-like FAD-dependent oxidoreductase
LYDSIQIRAAETLTLVLHAIKGNVIRKTDLTSWRRDKTGFRYLRIQRTSLMDVFDNAARLADIPIHFSKLLVGIAENSKGVTATFNNGTGNSGDFLLGCDEYAISGMISVYNFCKLDRLGIERNY